MTDQQFVPQPQPALPTPYSLHTEIRATPEGNVVILDWGTVTGHTVLFATPKDCMSLGKKLLNDGRSALSGLVLPPTMGNGHVPFDIGEDL